MGALSKYVAGARWLADPFSFLDGKLADGILTFRLDIPGMSAPLVTGEPALIEEILRNRALIGGRGTRFLRPVIGDSSLISLEGDRHEERRKLLLKHYFTTSDPRPEALTERRIRAFLAQVGRGREFDVLHAMESVNLDVIIEFVLGDMLDEQVAHFHRLIAEWIESLPHPAFLFLKPLQISVAGYAPWGRFLAKRAALMDALRERVRVGRAGMLHDFLVECREKGHAISEEEAVWEAIALLLFGHDTSAAGVAWLLHYLLRDPRRVAACVDSHEYLTASLRETLRLSPPVVHLTRVASEGTRVGSHEVAREGRVFPCMYLAHRNPAIYTDPSEFRPERFVNGLEPYKNAWFPFGFGNRLCIGMPFALKQMHVLARSLLAHGKLELIDPPLLGKARRKAVIMVPADGTRVRY